MIPTPQLIKFIKAYESIHDGDLSTIDLEPKLDPVGFWTEGWGKLMLKNGQKMTVKQFPTLASIMPYRTITNYAQADKDLVRTLVEVRNGVQRKLKVSLLPHQIESLISHAYNCGFSATLYTLINSNAPEWKIKDWYTTRYTTANGIYLKGLQYRRNDEYEMRLNGDYVRDYKISI